ncbi:UMP kinase [bacterium]|nr:UMP kinase [bacterium]
MCALKYKRILLKLSGEALLGDKDFGICPDTLNFIAHEIKKIYDKNVQIGIVVGGGNIFRGLKNSSKLGLNQATGDAIGMMATTMNSVILSEQLQNIGVKSVVLSAINMEKIAQFFVRQKAIGYLENNTVVIYAAGTGNPYFTTDTAAALRAIETECDVMIMAKNGVDGVYDDDPNINPHAKKYDKITYDEIIQKNLKVMDIASCVLSKQNNLPIQVFDFNLENGLLNILNGENVGTILY